MSPSILFDKLFLRSISFNTTTKKNNSNIGGLWAADILLVERLLQRQQVSSRGTTVVHDIDAAAAVASQNCNETMSPELPRTCPNNDDNDYHHETSRMAGRRSTYGGGNVGRYEMSTIATSDTIMFYDGERSLTMDSLDVTEHPGDEWLQNDHEVEDVIFHYQDYPEQQNDHEEDVMESFHRLSLDHQVKQNKKHIITSTSIANEKPTKNAKTSMENGLPSKPQPSRSHLFPPLPRGITNNKRPRRQVQTTVSFFYDSNEEISEDDNDDDFNRTGDEISNGKSRPRLTSNSGQNTLSTTPPSTVKHALGLQKKNIKEFLGRKTGTSTDQPSNSIDPHLMAWLIDKTTDCEEEEIEEEEEEEEEETGRKNKEHIIVMNVQTRPSTIATCLEHWLSHDMVNQVTKPMLLKKTLIASNALLIVTSKLEVEEWAGYIRDMPWARLKIYTDSLAKRRKLGAHYLAKFDVVVTTFDVLKAKEAGIPEEWSSESDELESIDSYQSSTHPNHHEFNNTKASKPSSSSSSSSSSSTTAPKTSTMSTKNTWLKKPETGCMIGISNLHLIQWRHVIVDIKKEEINKLRIGTKRGDAVTTLHALTRVCTSVLSSSSSEKIKSITTINPTTKQPIINRQTDREGMMALIRLCDHARSMLRVPLETKDKDILYDTRYLPVIQKS